MAFTLRIIAIIYALLGLVNLFDATQRAAQVGLPFFLTPRFNGWFLLISGLVLFTIAETVARHVKKTAKQRPGKAIDPKNEVRLRELKALRGRGLVGMREYKIKREEILKGL